MNRSGEANRSVRNTRRKLREGLLTLMEDRPIREISVKELTEMVDVNRGTFYFHYQDIYDLLRDMEQDFFEQFDRTLNSENRPALESGGFSVFDGEGTPYLHTVFSFIDDNCDFCRIMLSPHGDMEFVDQVKSMVDDTISYFWRVKGHDADPARYEMYNVFIINGCIGLIRKWLDDNDSTGPEEMAQLAAAIILASVNSCIS